MLDNIELTHQEKLVELFTNITGRNVEDAYHQCRYDCEAVKMSIEDICNQPVASVESVLFYLATHLSGVEKIIKQEWARRMTHGIVQIRLSNWRT